MKKWILLLFLVRFSAAHCQDTSNPKQILPAEDTATSGLYANLAVYPVPSKSNHRFYAICAVNTVAVTGTSWWLFNNWYKPYSTTHFHFFNDNDEWLQVDKMGHAYSAYSISRLNMNMWRWAGVSRRKSIWLGGASGAAYQTLIELYDGFSSGWGWSWGDFTSNIAGSAMLVTEEFWWGEQRVSFKFSFHRKSYGTDMLNQRADDIFGNRLIERMLKDYNGQTYWMSANLRSFFKNSNLPPWLNIAVGYGAENMFGAREDSWKDTNGIPIVLPPSLKRYRQFYIAPDIDLTRIKTKSKVLKTAFSMLNCIKFPAPSVEFSQGKVRWNWMHF